jgi:seryl-tRNA synthetase
MIDIKLLREKPEVVKKALKDRGEKINIDSIINQDKKYRQVLADVQNLRQLRNKVTKEVAEEKRKGKTDSDKIKKMKKVGNEIKKKEDDIRKIKGILRKALLTIPVIPHESVPIGSDEKDNEVVKRGLKPTKFSFTPKDHLTLSINLDLVDMEKAAEVSGSRFFYLKNEGFLLNLALAKYAIDFLIKKGFTPVRTPTLIRGFLMEGVGWLPKNADETYKIENDDLYLIGTSENALAGLHVNEVMRDLPKRYAAFTSCFRTEAGAHGRDTKGIFRTHEFDKIEQFVFTKQEDSWKELDFITKNAEELIKGLKLPYRIVNLCTGDLGTQCAKTYDIEVWMPAQKKYRELQSASNCLDFQSRGLGIKYEEKGERRYVHTLNSTALATGRTITAILENYQRKGGSVKVPTVLQKYMNGIKVIKRKK